MQPRGRERASVIATCSCTHSPTSIAKESKNCSKLPGELRVLEAARYECCIVSCAPETCRIESQVTGTLSFPLPERLS